MGYGKITAKQQEILDYIKDEILKRGYILVKIWNKTVYAVIKFGNEVYKYPRNKAYNNYKCW